MSYKIVANKPGATLTYPVRTERALLAKAQELRAAGFQVRLEGPDGAELHDTDVEDRMDELEGPDVNQRAKSIVDRATRGD